MQSYESRMSSDWLDDLKPLGTDWRKPFLETAPSSSSFSDEYEFGADGKRKTTITFKKVWA
jgi:hypothetical protein